MTNSGACMFRTLLLASCLVFGEDCVWKTGNHAASSCGMQAVKRFHIHSLNADND